jgi:hypothetical protein
VPVTPPINPKQIGVAFLLFALGYSLAGEQRSSRRILFNRLFEIYLFGIAAALLLSGTAYLERSRLALSNYLPFLFGVNVAFNYFPANPTTWYIGPYLHVLLVWALFLRNRRIGPWLLVAVAAGEVLTRAVLAETAGLFTAYMALPNWATVFLLGLYYGQRPRERPRTGLALSVLGLCLLAVAWPLFWNRWQVVPSFPFMGFLIGPPLVNLVVTSASVTAVYLLFTWLVYQVTLRLTAPRVVQFFARNTLIIFIAHMPLYFALEPLLAAWLPGHYWLRVGILFVLCFPVLALLSELVRRLVRPKQLAERVWLALSRAGSGGHRPEPSAATGAGGSGQWSVAGRQ